MSASVSLPWPPAAIGSNSTANRWRKAEATKRARDGAHWACLALRPVRLPETGDIPLLIELRAPSRAFDRANAPLLAKPLIDGLAAALGVNDRRFAPVWAYGPTGKPGAIVLTLGERALEALAAVQSVTVEDL